jgi:hypothetical protein
VGLSLSQPLRLTVSEEKELIELLTWLCLRGFKVGLLSIGVSTGSKIDVGDHLVEVVSVVKSGFKDTDPSLIVVRVDGGKEQIISDQMRTEILDEVFVSTGMGINNTGVRYLSESRAEIAMQLNEKITRIMQAESITPKELHYMLEHAAKFREHRRYFSWVFTIEKDCLVNMHRDQVAEIGEGDCQMQEEHLDCAGAGCKECGWLGSVIRRFYEDKAPSYEVRL